MVSNSAKSVLRTASRSFSRAICFNPRPARGTTSGGPNRDTHTIEVPATDQPHAELLIDVDSLKTAHHALLDSQ